MSTNEPKTRASLRRQGRSAISRGQAIHLSGVNKTYRPSTGVEIKAVHDLDLEIPPGQSVALMGTSGSGKSTLLHLLGSIDTPDSGVIRVGDTVVTDLKGNQAADYRASIGIVFQQFCILDSLTALANVTVPLIGRKSKQELTDLASRALSQVGLGERLDAYPHQLSGGQQQRLRSRHNKTRKPSCV